MAEQSREPEILKSIIDDTEYNKTPQSRNEEILLSILNDTEYTKTPQSREEELLLELKGKIGHGITVEPLSVTENGTYTAPTGKAYSPVEVTITPPQIVKRVTGNPIEFTDGADAPLVKCTTAIQGNQDLHGYDKPWVGGAGKNKWNEDYTGISSDIIYKAIYVGNGAFTMSTTTPPQQGAAPLFFLPGNVSSGASTATNGVSLGTSRTIASIDGYVTIAYRAFSSEYSPENYETQVESGSQATSYAPYSNICPITAYNQSTISVCGENRVDTSGTDTSKGYVSNSYLGSNGVINSGSTWRVSEYFSVYGGEVYDLSNLAGNAPSICFYDDNKNYISGVAYENSSTLELTTPSNAKYARLSFNKNNKSTIDIRWKNAPTHTTTYPSAIYRGSEDCVKGEVTSEKQVAKVSDFTWTYDSTYQRFLSSAVPGIKQVESRRGFVLSDSYEAITDGRPISNVPEFAIYVGGEQIVIHDSRYTSSSDFVTAMGNSEFAYELATPTTSSVTPTNLPIKSLFGYNHIESSTGDMVIDYITDQYQNFVDTVNRAVPNIRKSGHSAMDVFLSLEQYEEPEPEDDEKSVDDPTEELTEDKKENSK